MKKIIAIVSLVLVAITGFAQLTATSVGSNSIRMKTTLTSSVDSVTVTNAATGTLSIGFSTKEAKSIHLLVTKVSGTLAGTVTLNASNDGVNWTALTDATSTPTITTYTVTDGGTYAIPQNKLWKLGVNTFKFYQVSWVGSGTMSGRMKAVVYY